MDNVSDILWNVQYVPLDETMHRVKPDGYNILYKIVYRNVSTRECALSNGHISMGTKLSDVSDIIWG